MEKKLEDQHLHENKHPEGANLGQAAIDKAAVSLHYFKSVRRF